MKAETEVDTANYLPKIPLKYDISTYDLLLLDRGMMGNFPDSKQGSEYAKKEKTTAKTFHIILAQPKRHRKRYCNQDLL